MNSQQARERLKGAIKLGLPGTDRRQQDKLFALMAAVDVYGDARELEGHVAACMNTLHDDQNGIRRTCGDRWYCGKAPRRDA